jgi:hypothetical protein
MPHASCRCVQHDVHALRVRVHAEKPTDKNGAKQSCMREMVHCQPRKRQITKQSKLRSSLCLHFFNKSAYMHVLCLSSVGKPPFQISGNDLVLTFLQ